MRSFVFFCIFSPARQAVLLKFSALVSLFSGPEGLAAKRRFPYPDNIETIGETKNARFWLCDAENRDFACIIQNFPICVLRWFYDSSSALRILFGFVLWSMAILLRNCKVVLSSFCKSFLMPGVLFRLVFVVLLLLLLFLFLV